MASIARSIDWFDTSRSAWTPPPSQSSSQLFPQAQLFLDDLLCHTCIMSLGDWESDFPILESTYEEEVERWESYFRPSSSSDERTVDHSDQHSPSQPPPDASSPTKSTIASPRRSSESLAMSGATTDSRPLFVDGIISQLAELRKLYQSRSENPSCLRCAQWPIPRNKTKRSGEKEPIFRHCVCKAKVVSARQIASSGLTCCDPACAVPSGWHHERCVSEEERVAGRSNGRCMVLHLLPSALTSCRSLDLCISVFGRRSTSMAQEEHCDVLSRDWVEGGQREWLD